MKDIPEFEGLYQISKDGKVFSCTTNKYLKPKIDKYGYKAVCLVKDGKRYYKTIHRLVALTYLAKPDGCNIVNHLDSNKLNNDVSNLEWTTVSGNTKHCYLNNEQFRKQVLNNAKIGANKKKNKVNIKGIDFESQVEASRHFNVSIKTIYNWLHS